MPKLSITKFTQILTERGLISHEDLNKAMLKHEEDAISLEEAVIESGLIEKNKLMQIKAECLNLEYIDLVNKTDYEEYVRIIPETMCRRYQLICINKVKQRLILAMENPLDVFAIDDVRLRMGCVVEPVLSYGGDIKKAIIKVYGESSWQDLINKVEEEKVNVVKEEGKEETAVVIDAPLIKLVDQIIAQAVERKASDIHIEPFERDLKVRYRIDGIMQEVMSLSMELQPSITSRIKIMASLNITEKRLPQDGRIMLKVGNKDIDLRVAVVPTISGEDVVLRILDRKSVLINFEQIGFPPDIEVKFKQEIKRTTGIILVTGPTGSGKSTTLYAILNTLNSITKKIVTIEDPVEYYLHGINQVQVNPKVGLTFAVGLRAFFRQDPDIMMVGEVRDVETARVAIEAALTGHLVVSTLHTNDAPSAVTRLIEMNIEPFLVASSINCVLAQRLVRKICPYCKITIDPYPELLKVFDEFGISTSNINLAQGTGCSQCNNTGYKGRMGLYELMIMSPEIEKLVLSRATAKELLGVAKTQGLKTLKEDGLIKVTQGVTTLEEVLRVTYS
ncbi:MAG: ATPase, T2SS/T4P/T4SS family [bacterium]|nr:ATPase, T2SS/T4P/T4SS family [bacterium]